MRDLVVINGFSMRVDGCWNDDDVADGNAVEMAKSAILRDHVSLGCITTIIYPPCIYPPTERVWIDHAHGV